jgi:hypothetical protein
MSEEGRRQGESPSLDDRPRGHRHEDGRRRFPPSLQRLVQHRYERADIVGVEVATSGSDQGQMAPMVGQTHERYEQYPKDVLVDGSFIKHAV